MHKGACLCGAVTFEVTAELHAPDACHCSLCRRQSGHYWASTNVKRSDLQLMGADKITWYRASQKVRRGFCSICGAFLFWDPMAMDIIAIAMGAFDLPTGTRLAKHIFVGDKGDYYDIVDDLPQSREY